MPRPLASPLQAELLAEACAHARGPRTALELLDSGRTAGGRAGQRARQEREQFRAKVLRDLR